MKRPYRLGDWFAIPLGDGRYAPGIVARGTRKAIAGFAFGTIFAGVPAPADLASLRYDRAVWHGSFSDRAIVEDRWPVIGASATFTPALWPLQPSYERVVSPLALERLVATGTLPVLRRTVRDLRGHIDASELASLSIDAQLQWRTPLGRRSLDAIARWLEACPGASIRLYGDALEQLPHLADWAALRTLRLGAGAWPAALPTLRAVRSIAVEQMPATGRLARAFPNVRTLRIAAGNAPVDLRALDTLTELRVLDCTGGLVEHFASIADMKALRALRFSRTRGWCSLEPLAGTAIRALCLEQQVHLSDLEPLARMQHLEQLELRGLWQFNVDEMGWLTACDALRRATIDIGGRRKNVEVYRHGGWAAAWPFAWLAAAHGDATGAAAGLPVG